MASPLIVALYVPVAVWVATGVGLLLYAKSNMDIRRVEGPLLAGGVKSILDRMKAWFQGNF